MSDLYLKTNVKVTPALAWKVMHTLWPTDKPEPSEQDFSEWEELYEAYCDTRSWVVGHTLWEAMQERIDSLAFFYTGFDAVLIPGFEGDAAEMDREDVLCVYYSQRDMATPPGTYEKLLSLFTGYGLSFYSG